MRNLSILVILLCFSVSGFSQTSTKETKIRQLMELTGSGNLGVQATKNLFAMYKKNYTQVDTSFWDEIEKEVSADGLVNLVVPIYDKHFSEQEIDALITFYSSPAGKKIVQTLPIVMQESMAAGQQWGKELSEKVIEKMKAKGYL
jgi:hypothetical protein